MFGNFTTPGGNFTICSVILQPRALILQPRAPGPGARGRNQHVLWFSKAGTCKIQCFRPSGARKNIAFEAIKHCKLRCFVQQNTVNYSVLLLPRRILCVLGGLGGPRRPLALQGRSRGPLGPLLSAFLGRPGALLAALGALLAALGALLAALGALPGGPGGPSRLQIDPGRHKKASQEAPRAIKMDQPGFEPGTFGSTLLLRRCLNH